ncbi:melanopsin-A-like [Montipora capricornis]|uniref:melanopsin-A-like n=1 Tax=Montipora foliosa TaxID=591990 RepID=UPI0035F16D2E
MINTSHSPSFPRKNIDQPNQDDFLALRIFQGIGMCIFILTGIPGNFLVCYLVRRTRRLRTVTNLIISNLAVADLGVCLFNIPVSLVTVIFNRWVLTDFVCQIAGFTFALFLFEALWSLALVSISRYWCIVQPAKFSYIFTRRRTMAMIIATWALSLFCALPPLFGWSRYVFTVEKSTCYFDLREKKILPYAVTLAIVMFIIPYILITVPYSSIFRFIRGHSRRMSVNSVSSRFRKVSRPTFQDFKVTKLLLVVVCVFVACWTLHIVVNLLKGFSMIKSIPRILDAISIFLTFLSSSCNPFIYGLMNKKFRRGFRAVLCAPCQKCHKAKVSKLERKVSGETTRNLSSRSRSSNKKELKMVTEAVPTVYETCV